MALVERARSTGKLPISLDVEILGQISRVDRVDEVLERLYDFEEEEFTKPKTPSRENPRAPIIVPSAFGQSRPLSARERADTLEEWKREREAHLSAGRAHFLGVALPGVGIRVVSRDRFVSKPQLIVTIHDCEAFPYHDADDADYDKLVKPITPRASPFGIDPSVLDTQFLPWNYPVGWSNNGDNVEVILTPESFRPNVPWSSEGHDYVVLARDPQATT